MPEEPLTAAELRRKFDMLTAALPAERSNRIYEQLWALEGVEDLRDVQFG